jgi:hypothetical protein
VTIQKCKDVGSQSSGIPCSLACRQETLDSLRSSRQSCSTGNAKKLQLRARRSPDDNNLKTMGFPGPCPDANPGNGFTMSDLQECILTTHDQIFVGVCGGGTNLGEPEPVRTDCSPDCVPTSECPWGHVGLSRPLLSTEYDRAVVPTLTEHAAQVPKGRVREEQRQVPRVVCLKSVQKCRNAPRKLQGDATKAATSAAS